MEMAVGQYGDITGNMLADTAPFDHLARQKTGSLISFCFMLGGLLAGHKGAMVGEWGRIGMHLGTAFQLTNDIRNVTIDEGRGQSPARDLEIGRCTSITLALRSFGATGAVPAADELSMAVNLVEELERFHLDEAAKLARFARLPTELLTLVVNLGLARRFVGDQGTPRL